MLLSEAKRKLINAGYIIEASGKTNIEDFNKMKQDVYQLTQIAGSNFEFITRNVKGSVEDTRSTMKLIGKTYGTVTIDTGRPGFSRYRKVSLEKANQLIMDKKDELEKLGYNVEFKDEIIYIWMSKTEVETQKNEDGPVGYWSVGFGDGRINYIVYGLRYREDGVEYPKNPRKLAERCGENKFNYYFSVDTKVNKHSTYSALVKHIEKNGGSVVSEERLMDMWDGYFVTQEG